MNMPTRRLESLQAGTALLYGGNRVATVSNELAASFQAGDELHINNDTGEILHIPAHVRHLVQGVVASAADAAVELRDAPPERIASFFPQFVARLGDDTVWNEIVKANDDDVRTAAARGRSTTRLKLRTDTRKDMIEGLAAWTAELEASSGAVQETIDHGDWRVDVVTAPLGVVGFVFEGRPNVFADAAGVLATSNSAVMRIGGDALETATAIQSLALVPALRAAGLPEASISLIPSRERAAGWALFSDPRIALAVARGSGSAVTALGAIARQTGIPLSAHGTGGAWLIADNTAEADQLFNTVAHSLDRKVCNTLNVAVVLRDSAPRLIPRIVAAADEAAKARGTIARLHIVEGCEPYIPADLFETQIDVDRPEGARREPKASTLPLAELGTEWEWENTPELTIAVADSLDDAIDLFNDYSPQFVASLVSADDTAFDRFVRRVNAPFVGNGFTRWVDGQYALNLPELGLSNWQYGRQLNRSGVLTGADLVTRRIITHHTNDQQSR